MWLWGKSVFFLRMDFSKNFPEEDKKQIFIIEFVFVFGVFFSSNLPPNSSFYFYFFLYFFFSYFSNHVQEFNLTSWHFASGIFLLLLLLLCFSQKWTTSLSSSTSLSRRLLNCVHLTIIFYRKSVSWWCSPFVGFGKNHRIYLFLVKFY